MKKLLLYITIVMMLALLTISLVSAKLEVNVEVASPTLNPFGTQYITATANELGAGIIFVVQPAVAQENWLDKVIAGSPLAKAWNNLDSAAKDTINSAIGDKVVSYAFVSWGTNGGSTNPPLAFPNDFTGINGDPSTGLLGTYKVLFVYGSIQPFPVIEIDFACAEWNVVPEVPLGTAVASASLIGAAAAYALYRRRRFVKIP